MNVDADDFSRCHFYFAARIFFISIKIDPPDDQNQDIFFPGLRFVYHTVTSQILAIFSANIAGGATF